MAKTKPLPFSVVSTKHWIGVAAVMANIHRATDLIEGKTRGGMLAAGLVIKRDAVKLAPIDTGNLRNSAYVIAGGGKKGIKKSQTGKEGTFKTSKAGGSKTTAGSMKSQHENILSMRISHGGSLDKPFVEVGFTANYALAVHESVGRKFKVGQAKFLEHAITKNKREIKKQIMIRARVR